MGQRTLMITSRRPRLSGCATLALASFVAALFVCPAAAEAQAHRARLAQTLATQLSTTRTANIRALVQAPQSEIDRLSKTYGVRVVKRLALGAVLSGSAAQVNAVAGDR